MGCESHGAGGRSIPDARDGTSGVPDGPWWLTSRSLRTRLPRVAGSDAAAEGGPDPGPLVGDSPGQIRTAVARSLFDRFGSIQSLESLARDRIAVTIGR